ncbi:hypothetical protein [Botrimarina mediterranea]|uniref:Uncharacterized protein n=1 Tax=Botrimarina mediterranea TaxID=2528022 RepID=A0A518K748_9BACT|nr:hypothetical protein [Botrimarina mediterranea]QDV73600.1 hypothetical protein Spa11_17980 [Botrimarina mediterranea]QDV78191.1 hypothetical protein K2D_17970 [Planctomycetes bacterium K2D]
MKLLANGIDAWKHLGDRFSGEHLRVQTSDIVGLVLLAVGLAAGFWLLAFLSKWQRLHRAHSARAVTPRNLFSALVRAHGLSRRERSVCQQVAAELGLTDPAELFVRPETARPVLAARDRALAERLFC